MSWLGRLGAAVGSRRMPEWWESDGAGETRGSCQPQSNAAVNCKENIRPLGMEASVEKILMGSG
jgi:hypothetical protein